QNGWGLSITQQQRNLFGAWYTYDAGGATTWFVMPAGTWTGNSYAGKLYATSNGPWVGVPYNAATLQVQEVGTLTFNFTSATAGTMTYAFTAGPFAGVNQTKSIVRQPF
ncbi:MAG: hypothetical protein JNK75_05865, partial [Betaproteobacteria bacterium]|nr:hypothetical protein [Betaproteobacteria bacterium]